jgi:uncharacterized membrane protein
MEDAKHTHKSTKVIERPADEVFAYLLDLSNVPQWNPIVVQMGEGLDQPGARAEAGIRVPALVRVLGVEMQTTSHVLEVDEGQRRMAVQVEFPRGGSITGQLEVQDLGDSSAISFEQQVEIPGWLGDHGVGSDAIMIVVDHAVSTGLGRIQHILKGRHEATLKQLQQEVSGG